MPEAKHYRAQAKLLVDTLPLVANEEEFALKGGTAINFFIRNLPRISVDIDLTYLPVEDRHTSLVRIEMAMRRMARSIQAKLFNSQVKVVHREGIVTKIFVIASGVQVKVEVTPVMRGCVFAPQLLAVQPRVEAELGFAQMAVVSFADLYAGKIVAALDRQHPRDLFDLRELLALEGITQALRQTFIVYLISHNRTMAEVLAPTRRNLEHEFETSLVKMTRE